MTHEVNPSGFITKEINTNVVKNKRNVPVSGVSCGVTN